MVFSFDFAEASVCFVGFPEWRVGCQRCCSTQKQSNRQNFCSSLRGGASESYDGSETMLVELFSSGLKIGNGNHKVIIVVWNLAILISHRVLAHWYPGSTAGTKYLTLHFRHPQLYNKLGHWINVKQEINGATYSGRDEYATAQADIPLPIWFHPSHTHVPPLQRTLISHSLWTISIFNLKLQFHDWHVFLVNLSYASSAHLSLRELQPFYLEEDVFKPTLPKKGL